MLPSLNFIKNWKELGELKLDAQKNSKLPEKERDSHATNILYKIIKTQKKLKCYSRMKGFKKFR